MLCRCARISLFVSWLIAAFCCCVNSPSAVGGIYYDLGRPVNGSWHRHAWVVWDPILKRDLLWSQECSQDGAVLYALDIDSGDLVEAHDIPARELHKLLKTDNGVFYLLAVSGLTHPGNELLRFDPRKRKIERLGLASTPRNNCAGGVIGRDGRIYIGTYQQGRLFCFDPQTETWSDLGQKVPSPILPQQITWLDNLHLTSTEKILTTVTRTPPPQVVEIDPEAGSFRVIDSIRSRNFLVYDDRVLSPSPAGLNVYNSQYQLEDRLTVETLSGGAAYSPGTTLRLLSANEQAGVLARTGDDLVRIDLDQKHLSKIGKFPFQGGILTTTAGRRGTQICGLGKASDGSIYGTNIIGMHIFRHDPRTGQTRDLGHVGWRGGEVYNVIDVGGKIFFGTYTRGLWGVYDPKKTMESRLQDCWQRTRRQSAQAGTARQRR